MLGLGKLFGSGSKDSAADRRKKSGRRSDDPQSDRRQSDRREAQMERRIDVPEKHANPDPGALLDDGTLATDNRRTPRFGPSKVRANVNGSIMKIANISASGVLVTDGLPSWIKLGQGLVFDLNLPGHERVRSVTAQARITRIDDQGVALNYTSAQPNWDRLMTSYLASHS